MGEVVNLRRARLMAGPRKLFFPTDAFRQIEVRQNRSGFTGEDLIGAAERRGKQVSLHVSKTGLASRLVGYIEGRYFVMLANLQDYQER